nr:hypothetical protein [Tanacetum cinerariifolium]
MKVEPFLPPTNLTKKSGRLSTFSEPFMTCEQITEELNKLYYLSNEIDMAIQNTQNTITTTTSQTPPLPPYLPPTQTFIPLDQSLWIDGPSLQPSRIKHTYDHCQRSQTLTHEVHDEMRFMFHHIVEHLLTSQTENHEMVKASIKDLGSLVFYGGGLSDLDDIDDLEMIMQQVQADQEQEEEVKRVRHRNYIYRERLDVVERLMADYFDPNPKYPEVRPDATGLPGFSVIMKCTCAVRQLAYGVTPDSLDEYLQMGNHCARDCLDFFTMCVIELFMPEYLRKPDLDDIQNLYTAHNNIHDFSKMLGSIDCMHWECKNCPKAWHEQFARGDKKYPTIMLEAVASYDL